MEQKSSFSFSIGPLQIAMVVLIIIGAYLFGSLQNKVSQVQNQQKTEVSPTISPVVETANQIAAPPVGDLPEITDDDWVKGNTDAKLAFIEYSDMECPYCKQFHETMKKILSETQDLKWVYRHYPLSSHANAQKESEAAECVGELGGGDAFWTFIDTIYEKTTSNGIGFPLENLAPLAKEVGVDEKEFTSCFDSGKMTQKVRDQLNGGVKAGVTGTPGSFLLDLKTGEVQSIPGAVGYEDLKKVIDAALNK